MTMTGRNVAPEDRTEWGGRGAARGGRVDRVWGREGREDREGRAEWAARTSR